MVCVPGPVVQYKKLHPVESSEDAVLVFFC